MSKPMEYNRDAMDMLRATSRTFFIPISRLPADLKEAVTSAYLCMRAIDEIEDHPQLPSEAKVTLLRSISETLQKPFTADELVAPLKPYQSLLPEVTLRMGEWAQLAPESVQPEVYSRTAVMAEGMAGWVIKGWQVRTEEDLDDYTFYVAGLVGLLLNDLWKWYDGTEADEDLAVGYGRGLQAVNIIRNREEDLSRGDVDFYPDGWQAEDMFQYARRNLAMADAYTDSIQSKPVLDFCKIPLTLAHGTLRAIEAGETKLSRVAVKKLVQKIIGE
ncbi:phytoene/squalene synthase family protein [Desmospora profundinema]|uniref:Farnesyl-diphosphate farnesyltransferase n=1 Tax=Desmospora profundinema TaxID=1571184 RepID=A0ABU1IQ11_9BACL|nr:phytoene/squalene synthase family protein [Desmospora profundinema]MDR6226860.1 farnesyl-diphosphate farnesyltransferase [Desmospora profundinema]